MQMRRPRGPAKYHQGQSGDVLSVQFPAQIENCRSSGAAPDVLAASLASGPWSLWAKPSTGSAGRSARFTKPLRLLRRPRRRPVRGA